MLKPKLEKLTTKIDRIRRAYALTMKDLYLVSCYIRKISNTSTSTATVTAISKGTVDDENCLPVNYELNASVLAKEERTNI